MRLVRVGPPGSAVYGDYYSDADYWRIELQAGDVISVGVDTPGSDVYPYVELLNGSGQYITGDQDGGPGNDAFISHYVVPVSGSYYVKVGNTGEHADRAFELRVERARGVQLETDREYQNDGIGGANQRR